MVDGVEKEILRLIMNLGPANAVQRMILGDIRSLPYPGQWRAVEVQDNYVVLWSSTDPNCAITSSKCPSNGEPGAHLMKW